MKTNTTPSTRSWAPPALASPLRTSRITQLRHVFLVTLSFGLVALTPRSVEAVTLSLDDPNPVLEIPSSGSFVHTFTGTVSFDRGYELSSSTLSFPFVNGASPGLSFGNFLGVPYPGAENEGTFVGDLFSFIINSTDLPGLYNQSLGGGPATFSVGATDGISTVSSTVNYTITLVEPTGVPEGGGSLALFACGLGAVGAGRRFLNKRRA